MVGQAEAPKSEGKSKSDKKKFKKNALDFVNFEEESKRDPKFKTELCKTFTDNGFCAYGNKCRFAHGRDELFCKMTTHPKYRKSECLTFHSNSFCNYGNRCHFKHNECLKLFSINRSFYQLKLTIIGLREAERVIKRLPVFKMLTRQAENNPLNALTVINNNKKHPVMMLLTPKVSLNVNFITPLTNYKAKFISERKSSSGASSSEYSKSPINSTMSVEETLGTSKIGITRRLNFNECQYFNENEYDINLYS